MPESEDWSVTVHSSLDINFKTCLNDNWLLQAMALLCVCAPAISFVRACMCACVCVCLRACMCSRMRACVRGVHIHVSSTRSPETFSLAGT